MDVVKKAIRWISVAGISLMLLITVLLNVFPVEFKDGSVSLEFEKARFFGLPALTFMFLVSLIHTHDAIGVVVFKIVGAILLSGFVLYVMVMTLFAGMCQWTDRETVFINKHDVRKQIIVRDVGCGAWDSGPPFYKTVLVRDLSPWFKLVTAVDTTSIDRSIWIHP